MILFHAESTYRTTRDFLCHILDFDLVLLDTASILRSLNLNRMSEHENPKWQVQYDGEGVRECLNVFRIPIPS